MECQRSCEDGLSTLKDTLWGPIGGVVQRWWSAGAEALGCARSAPRDSDGVRVPEDLVPEDFEHPDSGLSSSWEAALAEQDATVAQGSRFANLAADSPPSAGPLGYVHPQGILLGAAGSAAAPGGRPRPRRPLNALRPALITTAGPRRPRLGAAHAASAASRLAPVTLDDLREAYTSFVRLRTTARWARAAPHFKHVQRWLAGPAPPRRQALMEAAVDARGDLRDDYACFARLRATARRAREAAVWKHVQRWLSETAPPPRQRLMQAAIEGRGAR
mmetsp:Transcript_127873/g.368291  ORF Transcript_127873/g.368291 Transcript_127873/m.368291 type:complete len:275 (+) Transcript_127873:89-913(+)